MKFRKLFFILGALIFLAGWGSDKSSPLTEVDVIRYAVFCPKFRQEVKKLELKGVINNYCVLKTDKLDGRLKKILKQSRYGDIKKYQEQSLKISTLIQMNLNKNQKNVSVNYTADEMSLVKKHINVLKELSK